MRCAALLLLVLAGSANTAWAQRSANSRPMRAHPAASAQFAYEQPVSSARATRSISFEEYVSQEGEELPPGDGGVVFEGDSEPGQYVDEATSLDGEGWIDHGPTCEDCGGRCPGDCRQHDYFGPLNGGWLDFDYVLWWGKGTDLPPLVTTSPVSNDPLTYGVLGAPGTQVLFGNQLVDTSSRSGGRIDGGIWFDECQDFGLGAAFLGIQREATVYDASSDGDPILARPFFNEETGANDAQVIAQPGVTSGGIHIQTANTVIGAEAYIRELLWTEPGYRLDCIYGYRVLRIDESVAIFDSTVITDPESLIPLGTELVSEDVFNTQNTFQGVNLGLISRSQHSCWGYDLIFKLGLGNIYQTAKIRGNTLITVPEDGSESFDEGLYALGTNIGGYSRNVFGIVPELGVNLHYQFSPSWRLKFGYTFLYFNNMLQAARIIDQNVNPTQIVGDLLGPARPAFAFSSESYWLQGINFGLECQY